MITSSLTAVTLARRRKSRHMSCCEGSVQTTSPLRRRPTRPNQFEPKFIPKHEQAERTASQHAHDELGAYIAIRNILLANVEKWPTSEAIASLRAANDVVENSAQPACAPYQAQHLSQTDQDAQSKVSQKVKQRIAQWSAAP